MQRGVDIEQSPLRQRGFVAAAGFVSLIAVCGTLLAVARLLGGGGTRPAMRAARPAAVMSMPTPAAPTPGPPGACRAMPAGSQVVPTVTPPGTRWALVGDMAEPSAPATVGPARTVDGFGECYAHSPLGALYAAENVMAAFTAQPQSVVIGELAAPGAARDFAVRKAVGGDNRRLQEIAGGPSTFIGFAFASYSPQEAAMTIAIEGPTGVQVGLPLVMRWIEADWRFVVPPNGQDFAATAVGSMDGFVAWSAG